MLQCSEEPLHTPSTIGHWLQTLWSQEAVLSKTEVSERLTGKALNPFVSIKRVCPMTSGGLRWEQGT